MSVPGVASAHALVEAQEQVPAAAEDQAPEAAPPTAPVAEPPPANTTAESGTPGSRLFGVLPNPATVEGATLVQPISTAQKFDLAARDSFDLFTFPFVAGVAAVGAGEGHEGYFKRCALVFGDNTVGSYLTVAVLPAVLHQDPRYFQQGRGGTWRRVSYALTRSFVTRSDTGATEFNVSEIGGSLLGAGLSNLYHPAGSRTVADMLTRWGMQVMWDTLSNELKEFWPDIRRRFRKS
jgi:hypothetical protein